MDQLIMDMVQIYPLPGVLFMLNLFPVIQGTMCNLQIDTTRTEGCHPQGHEAYPVYSCEPCDDLMGQEVHIINMHQSTGRQIPLTILADRSVRIKLLLACHQIIHWKISKPPSVEITNVYMTGVFNTYSKVTLEDGGYLNVTLRQRSFRVMDDTGIIEYATRHLGPVTSFSATYKACGWWITVGNCKTSSKNSYNASTQVPDAIWTPPVLTECTGKLPCWIKYDFSLPLKQLIDQCTGDQYVTWYKLLDTTYYIGASLCTNSRYSLFLTTSLRDRFRHIGDTNGQGEDHCELVGTGREYMPYVKMALESKFLYGVMGYSRDNWGEKFQKVEIKYMRRPRWYECGIMIPYAQKLYSESDLNAGSQPLTTGTIVVIVFAVLILVIILAICYRKHRKKRSSQATDSERTQDEPETVSAVRPNRRENSITLEPSALGFNFTPNIATPSAPMLPEQPQTPPQGERLNEEGAPPSYEDAMNYPLADPTKAEAPPPSYEAV